MPISDIRELIENLEKAGELKRVKTEVDSNLEIAEILRRTMYKNGPALLFENVIGRKFPVVSNLVGTRARFAQAISAKSSTIHQTMIKAINASKKPKVSIGITPILAL